VVAAYCYGLSIVLWHSVGLSVTIVSPAKTAEPMEIPFGIWTRVGPRNHVLDGGPDPHTLMDDFERQRGRTTTCLDMSGGRYTQSYSPGAALVRCRCRLVCSRWVAHWRSLANTIEPCLCRCAATMRPLIKLLWPLVTMFVIALTFSLCWRWLTSSTAR